MSSPTRFSPATKIPGVYFRHDANTVSYGTRTVKLSAVEADFLAALWNVYPVPMAVDDLLLAVYGGNEGDGITRSTVSLYVARLVKKLVNIPIEVVLQNSVVVLRARAFPNRNGKKSWTPTERAELQRLWAHGTPTQLLAACPGRTMLAIRVEAGRMRLWRKRQPLQEGRCADPLIETLVARRKAVNLMQHELALRIGTDKTKISQFERTGKGFSVFMLRAWCEALGVELCVVAKEPELAKERKIA